jgi:hypothetical protein
MVSAAAPARPGGTVYRIIWMPGTDRLLAECHCGARGEADDPVRAWEWLLAHPSHPAGARSPRTWSR